MIGSITSACKSKGVIKNNINSVTDKKIAVVHLRKKKTFYYLKCSSRIRGAATVGSADL